MFRDLKFGNVRHLYGAEDTATVIANDETEKVTSAVLSIQVAVMSIRK